MTAIAPPLSIALLNPFFWPEVRRGSERLVHDLAVDLVALSQRPRLITSHPGLPSRSIEDGFLVIRHWRPPEPWTVRRVEPQLSHVPLSYASLRLGHDDVATPSIHRRPGRAPLGLQDGRACRVFLYGSSFARGASQHANAQDHLGSAR